LLSNFGEWIRSERERKELSQAEVAEELGLHQTYYGKIELAQREVDLTTAMRICKVLGLDLSDFVKTHM
jgi:transcriptional regulator with XRE-family HTH domain